jgi:SAM-dependent methyltransferase
MSDGGSTIYDYQVILDGDSAPARVIRMTGKNKKVLEIGAGPGSITRHLSGTNGCDVVALEVDPKSLEKLKVHARRIVGADLNDPSWPDIFADEGKFDVVIAADVLEHVLDPLSVLKGMKSLLNENGSVILSLPHIGHSAIIACLMEEDFCYRDWGLLDRTHVQFFGIKNVQALYADAGMAIEYAEFVIKSPDVTEFADQWARMPADLRTAVSRNPFGQVYQVVTRAKSIENVAQPVNLLDMKVENPTIEIFPNPAAKHWAREMFRRYLGHGTRSWLKSIALKLGLNV